MSDTSTYRRQAGEEIIEIVCKARNKAYGDAEDNFQNIADLWNVIFAPKLCEELTSIDVARAMIQVKEARKIQDPEHEDSWLDTGGYTLCGLGITRARKAREEIDEAEAELTRFVDSLVRSEPNHNLGIGGFDPFAIDPKAGF
jgi:hypothetical protein